MGRPLKYKTGDKYGTWTIIESCHSKDSYGHWLHLCQCDCGKVLLRPPGSIKRSPSCPKCARKGDKGPNYAHGDTSYGKRDYLYRRWGRMRERCGDPNRDSYGGRGITVCAEWNDYSTFKEWALANGYKEGLTLDRIDVNGNYEPANCQWISMLEQQRNKRTSHYETAWGETKCLIEWVEDPRCVVPYYLIQNRLRSQSGRWESFEEILTTPSLH